jgi:predicted nuclease with TOPRIM domain
MPNININITENINRIFDEFFARAMNISGIVKSMGYTSSSQLHSVRKGESMLSTKAIAALIQNANVNPTYIFLGTGDMFLTEESELERLKKENLELIRKLKESELLITELNERIKHLEKRNADLIDISSAAIKYHKEHKDDEIKTE